MGENNLTQPSAVLFDLDGTLADTAQDLADALNQVLISQGKQPLEFADIRPWVSKGAPGLLKLGFHISPEEPLYELLRERLLNIYQLNICRKTRLFTELDRALITLENNSVPWGIVTNKPAFLTDHLMTKISIPNSPSVVISGDTFEQKKPHPKPLLEAAKSLGLEAQNIWYVGDDRRDMEAATAAQMVPIAALWGYIPTDDDPADWPAEHYSQTSEDFAALIDSMF